MSLLAVERPVRLEASEPPEARGLTRDGVRLLVTDPRGGLDQRTAGSRTCLDSSRPAT